MPKQQVGSPRELSICIDEKRSSFYMVKGIVWVDGIQIPFTASRRYRLNPNLSLSFKQSIAIRSKDSIIEKYKDKASIKARTRNTCIGWWIDRGQLETMHGSK